MSRVLVKFEGEFLIDENEKMEYCGCDPKQKRKKMTVKKWLNLTPYEQSWYALKNFIGSYDNSLDEDLTYVFEILEKDYDEII